MANVYDNMIRSPNRTAWIRVVREEQLSKEMSEYVRVLRNTGVEFGNGFFLKLSGKKRRLGGIE